MLEGSLRWMRAGFTISKLGWNVGTIMLQYFGIMQTSVQLGKMNTLRGLKLMADMPWTGKDNVFDFVAAQSDVMAQREETFNKDITLASQALRGRKGGKARDALEISYFYGIKKTQRFVDTWTWIAAKQAGMEKFGNDEAKANEFADRTVIRSQASGNFQERTQFERGSASVNIRQTELVRGFTALASYFIAKTNVAYERTKKTNFRNPGEALGWATDMALLYTVEAALVGLLRGQFPEEEDLDDPDDYFGAVAGYLGKETVKSLAAGIPGFREIASEASGFRGGGIVGNGLDMFKRVWEQSGQLYDDSGEFDTDALDRALFKSLNNFGGMLFKYPSSQLNKSLEAYALQQDGEDVDMIEFFMGPDFKKYR